MAKVNRELYSDQSRRRRASMGRAFGLCFAVNREPYCCRSSSKIRELKSSEVMRPTILPVRSDEEVPSRSADLVSTFKEKLDDRGQRNDTKSDNATNTYSSSSNKGSGRSDAQRKQSDNEEREETKMEEWQIAQ
ncbi:uncharacterized protein K489DRAFT_116156 [Dissoconium aciculare CBS 342.82]|uniref:Uncharacterized protein n=1 Tax=Dissoconium aciculare CBS 342.82 TaxID=1314786 RepID=A0A6J3MHS7_9PEZI|nr:uncharacterized protein K489DRAFT_116156 [Dissoconium aciculare CBS 342.82]KAF1826447.1 hypothetical protein K489DRAFT_116156 [Dissoconium aciculare CBS 342.82]